MKKNKQKLTKILSIVRKTEKIRQKNSKLTVQAMGSFNDVQLNYLF